MARPQPAPRKKAAERVISKDWEPLGFPCIGCEQRLDDPAAWCPKCRHLRNATNMRLARWRHRYGTTYPPLHPPARATETLMELLADTASPLTAGQILEALDTCEFAELLCIHRLVQEGVLIPRRMPTDQ